MTKRNEAYKALKAKSTSSDMFVSSEAQTFNAPMMTKSISATLPAMVETGCSAAPWDIYDSDPSRSIVQEADEDLVLDGGNEDASVSFA